MKSGRHAIRPPAHRRRGDHEAAAPERLGEPIHLRAKRNGIRATARRLGDATSILFYMGVHDIDALQWIGRSLISRVYAQKREILGTGNEDALYAVVNFDNGAIGSRPHPKRITANIAGNIKGRYRSA